MTLRARHRLPAVHARRGMIEGRRAPAARGVATGAVGEAAVVRAVAGHAGAARGVEAVGVAALAGEARMHAAERDRVAEVAGPRRRGVTAEALPTVGMGPRVARRAARLRVLERGRLPVRGHVAPGAQHRLHVLVRLGVAGRAAGGEAHHRVRRLGVALLADHRLVLRTQRRGVRERRAPRGEAVALGAGAAWGVRRLVAGLARPRRLLAVVAAQAVGHGGRVEVRLAGDAAVHHLGVALDAQRHLGVLRVREGDRRAEPAGLRRGSATRPRRPRAAPPGP